MKRVFVDTAPFIYLTEGTPDLREAVQYRLSAMISSGDELSTSVITLFETLVHPKKNHDESMASKYKAMFNTLLSDSIIPIDAVIAEKAANLRAIYGFKSVDSLQLSAAITVGCDVFYTNDLSLGRCRELEVITVKS